MSESKHCCVYIFSWPFIWKTALFLMLGIGTVIFGIYQWSSYPVDTEGARSTTLTDAKETTFLDIKKIKSMYLMLSKQDNPQFITIKDRATIKQILEAMQPASRDPDPAKWGDYALLITKFTNGEEIEISFYSTNEDVSSFSIDNVYYRGGSETKLKKLLKSLYYNNLVPE